MSLIGQYVQHLDEQELAVLKVDSDARRAARSETDEDRRRAAIKDRLEQRRTEWLAKKYGSALTR